MHESSSLSTARSFESIVAGKAPGVRGRYLKDNLARWVVGIGGLGVIGALLLIFVYLLSEVIPLFAPPRVEARQTIQVPGPQVPTVYVAAEEQGEVGMRLTAGGDIVFFDLHTGAVRSIQQLPQANRGIVGVTTLSADTGEVAVQWTDGRISIFRHTYRVTYPDDRRMITPVVEYPYGETPLAFMNEPGHALAVRSERGTLLMAGAARSGEIVLKRYTQEESLFGDVTLQEGPQSRFLPAVKPDILLLEPLLTWLYVIDRQSGKIAFYRLLTDEAPELVEVYAIGSAARDARYLAGGISIIVAQADGIVSQWFPARRPDGTAYLARVRTFAADTDGATITALGAELRRRTFAVGDETGRVTLFYATAGRRLITEKMLDEPVAHLSFNPRAKYLMAVGANGTIRGYDVHNEHPEVSWSALWGRVWYESYDEPRFLWQSSSASADFEPKFSLTPLSIGTLKGAFYAMIFAVPIAVLGAIFTAYFMSPEMRQLVKPTVEILAALPSVILGFLAGLWLAPYVETNLPGVFLTLLLLPLSIPLFGYLWAHLPRKLRYRIPPGWEAAILIPVVVLVVWFCFTIDKSIEAMLFGGNMQAWMDQELGIHYDQRNALVVGIAMGIAVIPIVFSIAEDAIFTVPKHLTLGSLALGATSWQTLTRVVLPTASPGIFSAIMIGMGRAVGETMIVLMATGNTPVTDFSLFQGMRTLAANIAVEMPESEVGSTHFRLLFLAGLVLFVFTFIFNTLAEIVRQRLRARYSAI
ncbi:phosphate transport system permease protein [Fontimonas thermophila]|uniref:Phosphate transport system permease protein n=1 Tax=Fontimonas thermophila TaxID=1076937 RepID=A0A1I2HYN9_9GAMM|nr:ABC transporter permease subunit [Fontimonas thermophila]SFF34563.1 phosphate transport system permease protein [Fontimonas thermophila]